MRFTRRRGHRVNAGVMRSKRAEEARQISESRFNQFFATLPDYCYMVSPSATILDVNPAACQALGYSKGNLVGKPLSVIYAPESRSRLRELFETWKKTGKICDEEMVIVTKQGEKRTVLLNVGSVLSPSGKLLHSTSVQVDITDRKRMEEKLREAQERLTDSIASMMEAIQTYAIPRGADSRGLRSEQGPIADRDKLQNLTRREREILHFLVCGVSTKRMSQLLDVRAATIRNHVQNLFSKLSVHSRLECVAVAHRLGFELRDSPPHSSERDLGQSS